MKKEYLILIGIIIAFAVYSVVVYNFGVQHQKIKYLESPPIIVKDTVKIIQGKYPAEIKIIEKRDTVFIKEKTKTQITPEIISKYIAVIDTTFSDSTLSGKIEFHSEAPLTKGFFILDLKQEIKKITEIILMPVDVPFYKTFTFGYLMGIITSIIFIIFL